MFRRLVLAASSLTVTAIALALVAGAGFSRPASALTNCSTDGQPITADEMQLFDFINQLRLANGLTPLKLSPALSRAAAWMSEDLVSHGTWSHTDSLGRSAFARVQQCGYHAFGAGENIAASVGGAKSVFLGWQDSSPHLANMVNPDWVVVGIGRQGSVWTADFGTTDDSNSPWDQGAGTATPRPPTKPPANTPPPTQPGGGATSTPSGNGTPTASPSSTPSAGGATPIPGYKLPSSFPIRRAMVPLIATE